MIDLHIHSMFSDGTDSLEDIVNIAHNKNIPAISLTDHDTTLGVLDIIKIAKNKNIKVVPGVEISSVSNGHLIHILGYNIDVHNNQLKDLLALVQDYFIKLFYDQYHWLRKNNIIDIDLEKILKHTEFKESLASLDILKTSIAEGAPYTLKDWPEFFNTKIKLFPGHFIEEFPIHPSEAVEVILNAGGLPVFAHPARIGNADINEMKLLLPHGLKGIEVYYPYHDKPLIDRYEEFANEHNLVKTGGTDWHGKELTTWNVEIGDCGVEKLTI
ncbi:MAG: PHP domain-containing protein [Tissierellia bacterium]|nr:PHP domain-containing protein [Tissierellia bacterium]